MYTQVPNKEHARIDGFVSYLTQAYHRYRAVEKEIHR
jgi:hypothetical protein